MAISKEEKLEKSAQILQKSWQFHNNLLWNVAVFFENFPKSSHDRLASDSLFNIKNGHKKNHWGEPASTSVFFCGKLLLRDNFYFQK